MLSQDRQKQRHANYPAASHVLLSERPVVRSASQRSLGVRHTPGATGCDDDTVKETRLVFAVSRVHYYAGRGHHMVRASRVDGDQAAPDGGCYGVMGATTDFAQPTQLELAYQVTSD